MKVLTRIKRLLDKMTKITVICQQCGKECQKNLGHVNKSKKMGWGLFCSQSCWGLSRRHNKTKEQLKAEKAEYDKKYRSENEEALKKKKHDAFVKDYATNPEKYKQQRQRRYPKHLEYLRRPEYKEYKKQYDQQYRLAKEYGEFSEAAKVLIELEAVLESKKIKYEQGLINKTQKRKRQWQRQNH